MTKRKILITGASSGIGAALAEELAGEGTVLGIVARRLERLHALQSRLEASGARVICYRADVRDRERMADTVRAFAETAGGISLVIANAGIRSAGGLIQGNVTGMADVFAVNVMGIVHTFAPALPFMIEQRAGHLVSIGSVAGFRGMANRSDYNASKAAVETLMQGYRLELRRLGIAVTNICPGFVESEMTQKNRFRMPFLLSTETAARIIAKAIHRKKKSYIFPWQWRVLLPLVTRIPDWAVPEFK